MKTAGIIAEYNPFHNGHKYQLDMVKENHERVIAIMSGSFVQRGDVAVLDKWTRAKAAIECGCDLVLELPVCYALNSARNFAAGAVNLLDRTNVVDTLCFGAECDDISALKDAAMLLDNEPAEVSDKIKNYIAHGYSYPKARAMAFSHILDPSILSEPNNILAVEYIRALLELDSNMNFSVIRRRGAQHNSDDEVNNISGASHIRKLIMHNEEYSHLVPPPAYKLYQKSVMPYDIRNIDSLIAGFLRLCDVEYLKTINDVSEGLENRILECAKVTSTFDDLCAQIKTKRYTLSRIRRVILSAVLGLSDAKDVNYIRVLAMNDTGKEILKDIKKKSELDIITKVSLYKKHDRMFELDIRATDIFALCAPEYCSRLGGMDYTTSPIIL